MIGELMIGKFSIGIPIWSVPTVVFAAGEPVAGAAAGGPVGVVANVEAVAAVDAVARFGLVTVVKTGMLSCGRGPGTRMRLQNSRSGSETREGGQANDCSFCTRLPVMVQLLTSATAAVGRGSEAFEKRFADTTAEPSGERPLSRTSSAVPEVAPLVRTSTTFS